jgi:hypothetical protein
MTLWVKATRSSVSTGVNSGALLMKYVTSLEFRTLRATTRGMAPFVRQAD